MLSLTLAAIYVQSPKDKLRNPLAELSAARVAFESKVVDVERYSGQEHIYSMPLDQHVIGFYPVGRSDCRYLVYVMKRPVWMLFQRLQGDKVHTLWRLRLRSVRRPLRYGGSIGAFLRANGVMPVGKVTRAEASALRARQAFAGYDMEGLNGDECAAWILQQDGTETPLSHYPSGIKCPIVPAEAKLLGLKPIY